MKSIALFGLLLGAATASLAQQTPFYLGKWAAPAGGGVRCDGIDSAECARRQQLAARMITYEFTDTLFEMGMDGVRPQQNPYRLVSLSDDIAVIEVVKDKDGTSVKFTLTRKGDGLCMSADKLNLCMQRAK